MRKHDMARSIISQLKFYSHDQDREYARDIPLRLVVKISDRNC